MKNRKTEKQKNRKVRKVSKFFVFCVFVFCVFVFCVFYSGNAALAVSIGSSIILSGIANSIDF